MNSRSFHLPATTQDIHDIAARAAETCRIVIQSVIPTDAWDAAQTRFYLTFRGLLEQARDDHTAPLHMPLLEGAGRSIADATLPVLLGGKAAAHLDLRDFLDPADAEFHDQCFVLARKLVGHGLVPDLRPDHATKVLAGIIAYTCMCEINPEDRTLTTVHRIVSDRQLIGHALKAMTYPNSGLEAVGERLLLMINLA